MLFLWLIMASATLCYQYLFLYDFLFIHSKMSIGVLEKGYLNLMKNLPIVFLFIHSKMPIGVLEKGYLNLMKNLPIVLWKNNCSECFCILFRKTSMVESFLGVLAGLPGTLPKISLEQLLCRVPVSACFVKKELHSTSYSRNFVEF